MAVYVVSRRWRLRFSSPSEGGRYHPVRKQLFTDSAIAEAKSQLPDSYYKLLLVINYGILEKDILRRRRSKW